ncbi:MAG: class B sortase [Oscillospiraceae bacterium]|nr:class B sortase [Oscillospiraceae bacterium]
MPVIRKLSGALAICLAVFMACVPQYGAFASSSQDSREEDGLSMSDTVPDRAAYARRARRLNPDTAGWLTVPGTGIDRAVLQNPPDMQDNTFYLNTDYYRAAERDGVPCTDFRVQIGGGRRHELSRNITIYGHSWTDNPGDPGGGPFVSIKRFRDPEFAKVTPYIFFSTAREVMVWEVFAVYDATTRFPYITPDPSDDRFLKTLDVIYDLSYYDYGVKISPDDKVITLSTCTYSTWDIPALPAPNDYRFVVMAKLLPPGAELKSEAVFTQKTRLLSPTKIDRRMERIGL